MIKRRTLLSISLVGAASQAFPWAAAAQEADWPKGTISFISGAPAGTSGDLLTRTVSNYLSKHQNVTTVVENKPGAFGTIAAQFVARSTPDGSTILIAPGASTLAPARYLYKSLSFDPMTDLTHVAALTTTPFVLVVSGKSDIQDVEGLVKYIRDNKGNTFYGSHSNSFQICCELFRNEFDLDTKGIKYRDPNEILRDLEAGTLTYAFMDYYAVNAQVQDGRVRPLSTTTEERFSVLPDIPSATESGANVIFQSFYSVHLPKDTPASIVAKLESICAEMRSDPEFLKVVDTIGWGILNADSQQLTELMQKVQNDWAGYVELAGIEPQ